MTASTAPLLIVAALAVRTAWSVPMPFPLPANFSFGQCSVDPSVMPGCATTRPLASTVSVMCSTKSGCSPACATSPLFQATLARFGARLGTQQAGSPSLHSSFSKTPGAEQVRKAVGRKEVGVTLMSMPIIQWLISQGFHTSMPLRLWHNANVVSSTCMFVLVLMSRSAVTGDFRSCSVD